MRDPGVLIYLQHVRRTEAELRILRMDLEQERQRYVDREAHLTQALARELERGAYEVVIGAPSSRPALAGAYVAAAVEVLRAVDLTSAFRKNGANAADAETFDQVYASINVIFDVTEARGRPCLIMDDVIGTGRTAGAILQRLIDAGAEPCTIAIAAPLVNHGVLRGTASLGTI